MPLLIRFLIHHFANGVVLGLACAEVILFTDAFQLGSLVETSRNSGGVTLLIFGQAALLFGTANMGVAVMNLR
jgi:hypothetical protein